MSSLSTKYIFPGELIDQVIDHLHNDSPSLRACCITCRAWAPSARFHIFHNIVVSAKRADELAVILETSPHISPLVRSLTIEGDAQLVYIRSDYLDAAIPAIAPKLTRLKTLRLERVTLAQQHPKVLSVLIHNFPTLQELCITSVTFTRFRDFAALIVAHPFLECLDLAFIWWDWDSLTAESHRENVFQEYPDLCSRLRCITLSRICLSVTDWISSYYRVLPVHTVTLDTISTRDIPRMARLLQLMGSSLKHLTLSIYQCLSESSSMKFPFGELLSPTDAILEKTKMDLLSSNTGLCTLTFNSIVLFGSYAQRQTYAWLPVLLSQVRSHYIEEVSFVLFWNHKVNLIKAVDLKLVQAIITRPVFSGLKRVIFRLVGVVDPVMASQAIRAQMNQLDGMGLLVFHCER
ncbi:hypothetical protein JB92DRAFT_2827030 [Gautieria morchelliformis]|nr:hypothetical protein JB92DRAFT_2827030 [Gautieria morchelliformis]